MTEQLRTLYNTLTTDRDEITRWTDSYFTNTREMVENDGDAIVEYAVFQRTPVMFAPEMAVGWLKEVARKGGFDVEFESKFKPGDIVPAGEAALYFRGPLSLLAECETFFNQKLGATQVAALDAYKCALALPDVAFIAMGARHCAGTEMQEMMDYAAAVGGDAAKAQGAKGFVNGASHATSHFFGQPKGTGTMNHATIGYYDSTLKAAQAYRRDHAEKAFIVLNDYFGKEITDAIEVCKAFPAEAASGELGFRLDTNGARYLEGLDNDKSHDVIRKFAPHMMTEHWNDKQLKTLYGEGVSIAAIFAFREALDQAGFPNVKIFGSSGFNPEKCEMMAKAKAPLDGVGTGSYIPKDFHATYATADIISYDSDYRIKVGREYLISDRKAKGSLPKL